MDMLNLPSENKASSSSIPPIFSNKYRNKVFYLITAFLLLIGICFATYYFWYGKYHQYTDDAYVNGNPIMITAQVPGIITKIYVQNTDYVEKDTPLVETDTTDFEISLDKCKQELANEIRLVASIFSKSNQLAANVEEKKSIFLKKVQDYERRVELAEGGSVSREDVDHSLFDMTSSYASLVAQEQEFFAAMTIIDGTSIASHPRVELAKQKVKKAWVDHRFAQRFD
ncbi:MAG: biotin/lipoyl-binding protein, partial [Chlamydiae bacterium]|nr:biotin/lipoyl-binding protein [Chlamydiota bacterium]